MHLYIFSETVTTNVSEISLKDGCLPSVGEYIHNPENLFLEPSTWFKVQVLDVVSVDCSRRQLSWEISSLDDGLEDDPGSLTKDADGVSYQKSDAGLLIAVCAEEFLDLDEVFDELPVHVTKYQSNSITKSQFYEGIVKLLHLYILPNVYLSSIHIPTLRSALQKQVSFLQTINEEINLNSLKFESITQAKKRLRQRFVSEVTDDDELVYSSSIMALLASDIDDDIRDITMDLEVAQDTVTRKKKLSVRGSMDQAELGKLAEARRSRDEVVRSYETLLNARENILLRKSLIENVGRKRQVQEFKVRDQPEHRIYTELTTLQEELIAKMRSLAGKKVMATSVRESMKRTVDELERGMDSFGAEVDSGGVVGERDDPDKPPTTSRSWMTLADQVKQVLSHPNHPVAAMHVTFCACVVERCRAAFNERLLYETNFADASDELAPLTFDRSYSEQLSTTSGEYYPEAFRVVVPSEQIQFGESSSLPPISSDRLYRKPHSGLFKKTSKKKDKVAKQGCPDPGTSLPSPSTTLYLLESAYDNAVLVFSDTADYAKRAIDSLKRDIAGHFETVTELLRTELKQKSKTSIWLSYESLFYDETMEHILTLYGLEYSAVTRMLGQSIRLLRVADLKFEDSILVNMLDDGSCSEITGDDDTPCIESGNGEPNEQSSNTLLETRDSLGMLSRENDLLEILSSAADSEVSVDELIPRLSCIINNEMKAADHGGSIGHPSLSIRRQPESMRSSLKPDTVRKSIRVSHILKTSIVYDRTVCSPPGLEAIPSGPEEQPSSRISGLLSMKKQFKRRGKEPDQKQRWLTRTMILKPELKKQFRPAFECLSAAVESRRLSTKFQQLTKCLREVSDQISTFRHRLKGFRGEKQTGCDELIDGLIILLSNLDESILSQLYIQIVMLIDLMPPFFKCNSFEFTLVQFLSAFQFLKEQILLKKSRPGCHDVV